MKTQSMTERGFTLVELLAVIVIMGILMALLLPAAGRMRESGRVTTTRQILIALSNSFTVYKMENGTFPSLESNNNQNIFRFGDQTTTFMGEIIKKSGFSPDGSSMLDYDRVYNQLANRDDIFLKNDSGVTVTSVLCDAWNRPIVWLPNVSATIGNTTIYNWDGTKILHGTESNDKYYTKVLGKALVDDELLVFSMGNQPDGVFTASGNNKMTTKQIGDDAVERFKKFVFSADL